MKSSLQCLEAVFGVVWFRSLHLSIFNSKYLEWGTAAWSLCGLPLSSEHWARPSLERPQSDRGTPSYNLGHSGLWLLVVTSELSPQYYGTMWVPMPLYLLFPWIPGQSWKSECDEVIMTPLSSGTKMWGKNSLESFLIFIQAPIGKYTGLRSRETSNNSSNIGLAKKSVCLVFFCRMVLIPFSCL